MSSDNLGHKSRQGLAWDILGTGFSQVASLVISIVLARLLVPEQFGIIGMAMAFVSITQIFIDLGFTEGLIQRKQVSESVYSSIFFINIAISLLLAGIIYGISSSVGIFYKSEEVTSVLRYLSVIPPIAALGRVHSAKLIKHLNFKALTLRNLLATIVGGSFGVLAALNDYGVYSLVLQQVITVLIGTILLWVSTRWVPVLLFSWKEVKEILTFSSYVFFDRLAQQFFDKIDTLFIGKVFSPSILGYYSRAESLKTLVNNYSTNSIAKVTFPLFSALQDDKERFNEVLTKVISVLIVVSTVLVGVLFFLSDWIILTLLGEKWRASISIFQILIFTCITLPFRTVLFKAALGMGYSSLKFKMGFVTNGVNLLSLPIGYFYGLEAFTWSYLGTRIIITIISWVVLKKKMKLRMQNSVFGMLLPLLILVFWVILYYSGSFNIPNILYVVFFILSYFTILLLFRSVGLSLILVELKNGRHFLQKKFR